MNTIKIHIADYYGIPSYYSVMPQPIFDSLEMAFINGDEYVNVEKEQFDKMIEEYNVKMNK